MELKHFLLALNLDNPLSLCQCCKMYGIEQSDNNRLEKLQLCLNQAYKAALEPSLLSRQKEEVSLIKKNNLKVITIFDKDYPENLKDIFDPPLLIYVKGDLKEADFCSLAIVGSRRASFQGIKFAENLSFSLSGYGITIVSGLALGIDAAAHRGALKAGGRTIAVLGSGFGFMYPAMNKKLAEDIFLSGAVISEFSYFTKPLPFNFPRRNRIISGLCSAVVVVEAAERSGSLITADFALEQGREVFAVPGFANAPNSRGTNRLIKEGAVLVETEADIIAALPEHMKSFLRKTNCKKTVEKKDLNEIEGRVYNLVKEKTVSIDEVCQSLKLCSSEALNILFKLQLEGLISQMPGKLFCMK